MLTPIKQGGFGIIDINEMVESLDLWSYGRLINSSHPFHMQVKDLINSNNLFNVNVNHAVDLKMKRSL